LSEKVKTFSSSSREELEKDINKWIAEEEMKGTSVKIISASLSVTYDVYFHVLIIYSY
jgi:hypothetical protein